MSIDAEWSISTYEHLWGLTPTGPLAGTVVLDLGQAAVGPAAACYLGMLGALVIKVESPRGDHVRYGKPTMQGMATTFIGNNVGKAGICIDFKTEPGQRRLLSLVRRSDVVIENFRGPDVMSRLGLPVTRFLDVNPDLVYVQSTAFGPTGPLTGMRSNEWVTQAVGGFAGATGDGGVPEFSRGTAHLDWTAAMINTVVALAGLVRVARGGGGVVLETSQLGSTIFTGASRWLTDRVGDAQPEGPVFWRCRDGYVAAADAPGVEAAEMSVRDLLAHFEAARIPAAPAGGSRWVTQRLEDDPRVGELGLLERVETPWGTINHPAPPWSFERTPASIVGGSPTLGQHDDLFPGDTDATPQSTGEDRSLRSTALKPLDARVGVVPGGLATAVAAFVLQALGAETNLLAPLPDEDVASIAAAYYGDVPVRADRPLAEADVDVILVGGPGFGTPPNGAASDTTIICRVSADEGGPLDDYGKSIPEGLIQALTGMNSFVGTPKEPKRLGYDLVGVAAGLAAAQGALAGLIGRERRGYGQEVSVSMLRTAVSISQWNIVAESDPDEPEGRQLDAYSWPPDNGFRCRDRYCLIDLRGDEAAWLSFFIKLDRADIVADPRFNDIHAFQLNRNLLPDILAPQLAEWSYEELEAFIRDELDGTIVPVLTPEEAIRHPQGRLLHVDVADGGTPSLRLPVKASAVVAPVPALGSREAS